MLSHADCDHLNGLLYILENFNVKEVWSNGEASKSSGYRRWRRTIAALQIDCPDWKRLPSMKVHRGVRLEILAPPPDFMLRRAGEIVVENDDLERIPHRGHQRVQPVGGDLYIHPRR